MYARRLETGPWFTVGEHLNGPAAHQRVVDVRHASEGAQRPYCVYVHVPFCASICSFCALYTQGVNANAHERFDEYLNAVLRSLESSPWYGSAEPPTTVHFGGGTPLHLGLTRFERLVRALRDAFGTSVTTEWAVETTTSSLDAGTVDLLGALAFRRVHLGIQTLDDAIRRRVGRRESGDAAIERIMDLEARGFLTSVDLILGLDGMDEVIVEQDLQRLYQAGVRMFSICELRERSQAALLATRDDPIRAERHYALWQTIWSFMERVGLIPIHVGQFARSQADNLYFTHPARGEDCVAIGPYAHGSAGHVSYGNLLLPDYYLAIRQGLTPIAMGVDYRDGERVVCALERELLTHRVSGTVLRDVLNKYADGFQRLLDRWFAGDLLRAVDGDGEFALTAGGSWFVGNMIADARGLAEGR